jgi:hypothetical protein
MHSARKREPAHAIRLILRKDNPLVSLGRQGRVCSELPIVHQGRQQAAVLRSELSENRHLPGCGKQQRADKLNNMSLYGRPL